MNYREAYGIYASNGILFNHESPKRGETFVSRKITRAVAAIEAGLQDSVYLGNLSAERDWGHAKDYVRGMWAILQHDRPDDFVLATGQCYSVRQFAERAFGRIGIDLLWQGSGTDEVGVDGKTGRVLVRVDARYFRPTEVNRLRGDAAKAGRLLDWRPTVTFSDMVNEMVDADRLALRKRT